MPKPKPPMLKHVVQPDGRFDAETYAAELRGWQRKLAAVQVAYRHFGLRGIVVFEGWDAAGKGGAIRRMAWVLDPRTFAVHPIAAPTPEDVGRHHLRRFWLRLPAPGGLVVFDRSWYGRVLVERVEGLVDAATWRRGYREIREFERQLVDDGVRIVKLFLHIDKDEQARRFRKRYEDPHKRWKLTAADFRNRARWEDYAAATDAMFAETCTAIAPWHVIAANDKRRARIDCLKAVVEGLGHGVDLSDPPLDPEVAAAAGIFLAKDEGA